MNKSSSSHSMQKRVTCVFMLEQYPLPLPEFQDIPVETIVVTIRSCDGMTDDSLCSKCDAAVKKEELR